MQNVSRRESLRLSSNPSNTFRTLKRQRGTQVETSGGSKKRKKMNYSTPDNYRSTPAIPDDVSPVEPPRKDSATESEEEGGIGTGKTGRLFEMGNCQITPPKEESDILTEVKEVVTVYSLKRE